MARLPSLERWSATMMWSANRLVTERNRSRIHASLRTGVTTTTRTGSDTVLRYDGELERETARGVCGTGTAFAYWCGEPRRLSDGVRWGVAPGQRHAWVPGRAGGPVSDARRRRRARRWSDRRNRELQGPLHGRARVRGAALRTGECGGDRPAHVALHHRSRPRHRSVFL